ncbi:hypothetical protein BS47DRAFT_1379461 [Hydnum rufescens UP504]|uniref:Transcriptional adapter 2 n=1 Tax=Hydnum rufescens UP504 TaxID=1448309 RepID=A0A9P6E1B0_9AGAM|nr:hypothetical protein BS47DRAFT_1379461 [Hydnum rufescens UP504]
MTVTHRKAPADSTIQVAATVVTEPGVLYQCDSCDSDITHTIRIKCAAQGCEEVDLCPSCFCSGKEVGQHKAWHGYRVVERHSYPIFTVDWGADEELLLIEGLILNGLGNWAAAAEHIGTRTAEEAETHYREVYQNSPNWPLPRLDLKFDVDPEIFHSQKKERIATMRSTALELANSTSIPKPALTSGPTNHEVQGFMPGRLEFETEVENEAEEQVKDLEFGLVLEYGGDQQPVPDPPPVPDASASDADGKKDDEADASADTTLGENEESGPTPYVPDPVETHDSMTLKLTLLDIYYEKLDRRAEAKAFIFDRGMLEYKKWQAVEKKRSKEDRDMINKHKPFAKLQTAPDFEQFINGVMQESALRARIVELQEYRRQGITTFADAEKYVKEKRLARNATYRDTSVDRGLHHHRPNGRLSSVPPSQDSQSQIFDSQPIQPAPLESNAKPHTTGRRIPAPLNLANAASLHLLTPAEQALCSTMRILPKPYLIIKETLVSEFAKRGGNLRRRDARDLIKIDVNKTSRIWDFLEAENLLVVKNPSTTTGTNANANTTS